MVAKKLPMRWVWKRADYGKGAKTRLKPPEAAVAERANLL